MEPFLALLFFFLSTLGIIIFYLNQALNNLLPKRVPNSANNEPLYPTLQACVLAHTAQKWHIACEETRLPKSFSPQNTQNSM